MKWLKFSEKAKRDKILTVRITQDTYENLVQVCKWLTKKRKQNTSQSDLIEQLILVAFDEMEKEKRKR